METCEIVQHASAFAAAAFAGLGARCSAARHPREIRWWLVIGEVMESGTFGILLAILAHWQYPTAPQLGIGAAIAAGLLGRHRLRVFWAIIRTAIKNYDEKRTDDE